MTAPAFRGRWQPATATPGPAAFLDTWDGPLCLTPTLLDLGRSYGLDGLESAFLNAYGSALRNGPTEQLEDATQLAEHSLPVGWHP